MAHGMLHAAKSSHPIVLNYRSVLKVNPFSHLPQQNPEAAVAPVTISKVAVGKAGGVDHAVEEYNIVTRAHCYACQKDLDSTNPLLAPLIASIIASHSAIEASKIDEWEHEYKPCKHTLGLVQLKDIKPLGPAELSHCHDCSLSSNMWFCLTCGHLGCGRKGYEGSGGNNHAIDHNKNTGHPVVVKMGTITPDGKACTPPFMTFTP